MLQRQAEGPVARLFLLVARIILVRFQSTTQMNYLRGTERHCVRLIITTRDQHANTKTRQIEGGKRGSSQKNEIQGNQKKTRKQEKRETKNKQPMNQDNG